MARVSKKPLISVVVPVYKVEKYIDKCVGSIINQTYENLEIVLVDDGSPDNCPKICDEWAKKDRRIKVIHKKNGGVSSARNEGIKKTNGEFIAYIDSDDWIEKDYIYELYNSIEKNDAQVALCSYNRVVGKKIENILISNGETVVNQKKFLINVLNPQTGFGFCHMKLYKKECIKNIEFNKDLKIGEDALYNIQVSSKIKKAAILNKCLYNYRINENSVVKSFDENYVDKFLTSMKINKNYVLNNYDDKDIIQSIHNFVAYHAMLIAVNYCFNKQNKETNQTKLLKEVCNLDIFKESIKKSNYKKISFTRKVTLFTLKYKLYGITKIICLIRQAQNKGDV